MRLTFDLNNRVEKPTIILAKRNYDIIGELNNYTDASYDYNLNSSNNISFCIYNTDDTNYWDEVKDRRLIWIKELSEWFEITVKDTEDEKGTARKDIEGVSLCEAELSQILVVNTEINTEKDIDRKDYEVTVFYKPENPKASMLHRILKKAPHYSIGHVDDSLKNIQRSFSLNSKSIYDVLTGDIAEEIGCLFLFDSNTRTINVYDLETNCLHCGHRESFNDYCPECGSDNLDYGYGIDTTILVDNETLGKTISLESKADEYKNYFKLTAGDDYMTDTVMSCNPNGSPYIYSFPQSDKDDMSNELVSKLEEYTTVYNEQVQKYQDIMLEKYNLIDKRTELDSKMMPGDIHVPPTTTAKDELSKLRTESLSPVAVTDVSKLSVYTADNAVLSMAKCLINTSVFKLTIIKDSSELIGQTWKGRFHIENMSDEEDVADSEKDIIVGVNDDYQMFIKQKLDKTIDRNDPYLVDMFDNKVSLDDFKAELKKYCYKRLDSFKNAYEELLDAMLKAGIADNSTYGDAHNDLYLPYFNKFEAIQDEKTIRDLEIKEVNDKLSDILKQQKDINDKVNLEKFLGDTLYKELCMFIREDEYSNSNYISDGLDNAEIFKKAKEFFNVALKEISKASTPQWTLSATLNDFLALPEFKPLWSSFNGGNWIRVKIDDKIFRLRLVHYTIDFENLETLNVEFSDVTITSNGLNDIQNVLEQAKSMATSFSYIAHQSEQGSSSFTELDKIRNDGLNASLYNIATSENQEFTIDSHGITGRYFDDIENDYSPEQVKFNNNSIVFTDNNWETAKTALGKITYENPFSGIPETKYGLLADAVIAGILMGNDIIGGNIYSENYSSTTGTHLNLNNGDFSFAGGKLVYDSETNEMTLKGVTLKWDDIEGLEDEFNKITDILDGNYTTTIGEDYVISPHIAGGYLYITGDNGSVEINPKKYIYDGSSGNIFSIKNSSNKEVIGLNSDGNAYVDGEINSKKGVIGCWTIDNSSIYRNDSSWGSSTGMYFGTKGLSIKDKFKVSNNGVITATDGTIGAFKIVTDNSQGYKTGTLYTDLISSDTGDIYGHGDQFQLSLETFDIHDTTENREAIKIRRRLLPSTDYPWVNLYKLLYTGQQICSGTYPQIIGDGQILQLSAQSDALYGVVIEASCFRPATNNGQFALGSDNHKWGQIYSSNSVISTSDRNEKNTINTLDEDLTKKFIMSLNPVSYKYNNGTSDRLHYGLISQDVENSLNQLNIPTKDFAGFIKSPKTETNYDTMEETIIEGEYNYGLRYEEFIAPLIKLVQVQENRIKKLEEEIEKINN